MKKFLSAVIVASLLTALAVAQSASDPQGSTPAAQNPSSTQQSPDTTGTPSGNAAPAANAQATDSASQGSRIAPGTVIPAELAKSIDSKKAKTGDPVMAKTSQDLLSNGQVVIPRGSKIVGHVTQAAGGKKGEQSTLGIAFDKLVKKDGTELPLVATIQAVAKPQPSPALASGNEPMSETGGAPAGNPGGGYGAGGYGGGNRNSAPGAGGPPTPDPSATSAGTGVSQGGALSPGSQGVMGMEGVTLSQPGGQQGTVLTSADHNVKLDSGTQLMLRTQ